VLPTVLKGLAKFSHLINADLVLDLLECLKLLIHPSAIPQLSVESALHCITTAFATLRTHVNTLTIDLKEFYTHLYALLWRLAEPANYPHISLALHCVDVMFQHTRQVFHLMIFSLSHIQYTIIRMALMLSSIFVDAVPAALVYRLRTTLN
jgi:nucleolar complex protein 3